MKRVLLVLPWDPEEGHNARASSLQRLFANAGYDATLLHLRTHKSHALSELLRNSLTFRVAVSRKGSATSVALDPFLNYAPGLNLSTELSASAGKAVGLRDRLVRLLSPLGLVREASCLLSLWLYALLRFGKFEWCLGFDPGGALVAWLLKKTGRVQTFVYEDQDYGSLGGSLRQKVMGYLERRLLKRADLVISVGFRLSALRRTQTSRPCHVVHNGAPLEAFEVGRHKIAGPPTLVFAGNIHTWDGLDVAIEALPQIRSRAGPVRLLVVGSGMPAVMDRLRAIAAERGVSDLVHFLGSKPHDELPGIFRQAHIGLAHFQPAPFRVFSFPLKVIEYMAAGMPVIATVDTEAGDLVSRARCGLSLPFDAGSLADAVSSLLLDPAQCQELANNAVAESRRFDWNAIFAQEVEAIGSSERSPGRR